MQYYIQPGFRARSQQRMAGFTLVELLVALALSGVIALAAIASLSVARTGFNAVDVSSQLRDNGRFASEMIQRIVVQSAFQDTNFAAATKVTGFNAVGGTATIPNITGGNNQLAKIVSTTNAIGLGTDFVTRIGASLADSNCASTTDTACANGSDVLVVRYQTSPVVPGSATTDGTMINCAGIADTVVPATANDKVINVFHVARPANSTEPALMCSYFNSATAAWITVPLVDGVESFQVLYGLDGAVGAVNTQFTFPNADTVPDRYLNASQMVVAGVPDSAASHSNWQRVRSLRIGLVLRGPPNSAPVKVAAGVANLCPLGFLQPNTLIPQTLSGQPSSISTDCIDPPAAGDTQTTSPGAEFPRKGATITDDGRSRQVLTFTINLRNTQ